MNKFIFFKKKMRDIHAIPYGVYLLYTYTMRYRRGAFVWAKQVDDDLMAWRPPCVAHIHNVVYCIFRLRRRPRNASYTFACAHDVELESTSDGVAFLTACYSIEIFSGKSNKMKFTILGKLTTLNRQHRWRHIFCAVFFFQTIATQRFSVEYCACAPVHVGHIVYFLKKVQIHVKYISSKNHREKYNFFVAQ